MERTHLFPRELIIFHPELFSLGHTPTSTKDTHRTSRQVWTWQKISLQKIEDIDKSLPDIMMIKEFSNLIRWEYFGL